MANGLTWVRFENGKTKQVSTKIAMNENHQKSHKFKPISEPPSESAQPVIPQKKIAKSVNTSPVAEEKANEEVTAQVETVTLTEEIETKPEPKKRGRKPKTV